MAKQVLTLGHDKKVMGVCSGLADYFDTDPTLMRILALLLIVFSGIIPGLIAYFVIGAIMPPAPKST